MAHIIDSEKAEALKQADGKAYTEHLAELHNREQARLDIGNLEESALLVPRQMGNSMSPEFLETIILRLVPYGLTFQVHPSKPWIKCVYITVPGQPPTYVFAFENRRMPEYDVKYAIRSWVPDPDYKKIERTDIKGDKPVSLEQADDLLKKHGFYGALKELRKRDTNPNRVGFKQIVKDGGTAIRGWRSVLSILAESGLATREAVDRIASKYGTQDRASWASHLGKQNLDVKG